MRSRIALVLLFAAVAFTVTFTFPLSAWAGAIEPALERRLLVSGPDDLVPVIIRPLGTLLGSALKRQVAAQYATRAEQHQAAVTALRATADATQPPILSALASSDFAGRVADVRNFWIDNVITARMTPSAIAEVASRADVEEVILYPAVTLVTPLGSREEVAPSDGIGIAQPGLRAIRADSLWRMGYTGKGRLVGSIDTGVDGRHLDLSGRWRGHNGYSVRESWFNPTSDDTLPHIFPGEDNTPDHGTWVMGIMVARGEILSADTFGVCFDAQWISAAEIGAGILGADIIEGMQWMADPDGDPNTEEDVPDAVANSWGIVEDTAAPCSHAFWNAIDNVEAAGAAMIFAAGNVISGNPYSRRTWMPGNRNTSEINVFSVGMVNANIPSLPISVQSSRGPSPCDNATIKPEVVGPGEEVITTHRGNNYAAVTGTSFAVPHVAGAVALLREYNPNATVDTIKWALLHSARDLGDPGPDNAYGNGFIDLVAALNLLPANNQPALYVKRDIYDRPGPGTSVPLVIVLRSQGPAVSGVSVIMDSEDHRLTIRNATASFGDFAAVGDTSGNYGNPFIVEVDSSALPGEQLPVRFDITGSDGYARSLKGAIQVGPAQANALFTHTAGNFQLTVSAMGMFGLDQEGIAPRVGGRGYIFGNDPTQSLFEGSFLVGTDSVRVSDNARDWINQPDVDFEVSPGGRLDVAKPGVKHAEETRGAFSDRLAEHPIGLFVEQRTYVDTTSEDANYLVAEYTIHNRSGSSITGLRAGLYFDWDFPWGGGQAAERDSGGFDASEGIGWMKEQGENRFRGLAVLAPPGTTSYRYFDNVTEIYGQNRDCMACDGFTDVEKWRAMSGGFAVTGPKVAGDGSHLIATGPLTIPPDSAVTVAFTIIGDTTRSGMLASAIRARIRYSGNSLTVYPGSLSFAAPVGGADPSPKDLLITNGTATSVTFTVVKNPDWAAVAPVSGLIASGQVATLVVTPALGGRPIGSYRDTILITTSDAVRDSIVIPATLTVNPKVVTAITPNPFNPDKGPVTMTITLSSDTRVRAKVYDLTGQEVRSLLNETLMAGERTISWDGKSSGGRIAAEGVYFCHIESDGGFKKTFTIVLKK